MIGDELNHYRILEKIGEGGMGVVYKAHDLRLKRDVALKFLPPDFTASEELKERFMQEAQAASALDQHPNICTIHAIEEAAEGRLFIAMAYYEGETVKAKIKRGPLPVEEIVDIASQVAAGLYTAHDRGLLHMDIKPANLMVTRDGTVKILDFGLSKFMSEVDRSSSGGPPMLQMGTVAYMSPERVQNHLAGPQSDIWSLGVVLYEMATGERPFPGSNDMSVLYSIVHLDMAPPLEKIGDLPAELDKIIRRSLVKEPRYRYQTIAELIADLEPLQGTTQTISGPLPWLSSSSRRPPIASVLIVGALALFILGLFFWPPADEFLPQQQRVYTVDFLNETGDPNLDWVGKLLQVLIQLELPEKEGSLLWTPFEELGDSQAKDLISRFHPRDCFDEIALERLRPLTGVTHFLGGGFRTLEPKLPASSPPFAVTVLLQELRRGNCKSFLSDATLLELPQAVESLAQEVAGPLRVAPVSSLRPQLRPTAVPVPASTVMASVREHLRLLDANTADLFLQEALEIAPRHAAVHVLAAEVKMLLGTLEAARDHSRQAIELSWGQSLQERLPAHAVDREVHRDRCSAALLLKLVELIETDGEPERVASSLAGEDLQKWIDRRCQLASNLARCGQKLEAQKVLEPVLTVAPEEPRVLIFKASAALSLEEEQRLARRAAELATQRGDRLVVARAHNLEASALWQLGRPGEAEQVAKKARQITADAGFLYGEADANATLGVARYLQQDLVGAREYYDVASRLYSQLGNDLMLTRMLVNTALVLRQRGDPKAALNVLEQALDRYPRIDDAVGELETYINYADVLLLFGRIDDVEAVHRKVQELTADATDPLMRASYLAAKGRLEALRGHPDDALPMLEEARRIYDERAQATGMAQALVRTAWIHRQQGSLDEALERFETARERLEESSDPPFYTIAEIRQGWGEALLDRGMIDEARKVFQDFLSGDIAAAPPHLAADIRLSWATLLVEEGRAAEAELEARRALADLESRGTLRTISRGYGILARSLVEQGALAKARVVLDKARQTLPSPGLLADRVPLDILEARLLAGEGHVRQAHDLLDKLQGELTRPRFVRWDWETQIVRAQIDLANGSLQAIGQMRRVESEARSQSFLPLAERARRVAASALLPAPAQ